MTLPTSKCSSSTTGLREHHPSSLQAWLTDRWAHRTVSDSANGDHHRKPTALLRPAAGRRTKRSSIVLRQTPLLQSGSNSA